MTGAYYNEHDHFAAEWLRGLIREGLIATGEVDERDIRDVQSSDLRGFDQHHFFAGIGGWSYALRLAGWPDSRPVWTGSCPCQPFSDAGKSEGFDDPRHLWPAWFRLIRECRPSVVFGEQVASKDALAWLDTVSTDLEAEDYAFGAADLCAAGVGAPHRRQRLFFVADAKGREQHGREGSRDGTQELEASRIRDVATGRLRGPRGMGHSESQGPQGAGRNRGATFGGQRGRLAGLSGSTWTDPEWLPCRDGKSRPTEPGLFPLAHGVSNRVGTLRGAGNAIVPQVAAEFVGAYLEVIA